MCEETAVVWIGASLQFIWLPVCHTAGLNGPRNIIHRYVTGYAHKSLRLADFLQGRMERDACNAFHCRRQPWRVRLQSHPIWRFLRAFDAYLFKGLRSCPVYAAWFIQTMTHVSDGVTGQNIGQKKNIAAVYELMPWKKGSTCLTLPYFVHIVYFTYCVYLHL